ncbi:MAG: hypothetical protein JJ992_19670, partial [Planctomycetes bacterium]|nr:hypothetical protein [Planctomycetota bacterium]
KEAAVRTTETIRDATSLDDGDVSERLAEADEQERERRLTDPETRQLRLDETDQVTLQKTIEDRAKQAKDNADVEDKATDVDAKGKDAKKKKGPGKLPQRPESMAKDSREAAAVMLRKFFNKR